MMSSWGVGIPLSKFLWGNVFLKNHGKRVAYHVVDWSTLILGVVLSFLSAYACIFMFLKVIERMGMLPFVIYRLLLGVGLIVFLTL